MQQAAQHIAEESYGFSNHEIQIGFEGSFGRNSVSPRGLTSSLLSNLVEVEGIVTKLSIVRPKIQRSIHLIAETGKYVSREYRDATAIDIGIKYGSYGNGALSAVTEHLPTGAAMPSKDKDGKRLELEHGLSQYKDYQTAILQEMPERAKVGQLPRSVEIILEHDLVDRLKPGDRVRCVGVYLPLPTGLLNGSGSGIFKSLLLCNNVAVIGKDVGNITLTPHDVSNIRYRIS
jgi:DNA replication licensing factor MCM3